MMLAERYVIKRKSKFRYLFVLLIIGGIVFAGYRFWPKILGYWSIKTDVLALRLKEIQKISNTSSLQELDKIIKLLQKDLRRNPTKSSTYQIIGQAYMAYYPNSFEKIIFSLMEREMGPFTLNILDLKKLEKSEEYLLRGRFFSKNAENQRIFRLLLARNYLYRDFFHIEKAKNFYINRIQDLKIEHLSLKEIEMMLLLAIRSGDLILFQNIIDKLKKKDEKLFAGNYPFIDKNIDLLKGLTFYYNKKWVNAISYIKPIYNKREQLFQQSRTRELLGVFLAHIYYKNLLYRKSEEYLKRVIEEHPNSANAYNLLGKIFYEQKYKDRAKKAFANAVRLNPQLKEANYFQTVLAY